jgi:hypothetical protein
MRHADLVEARVWLAVAQDGNVNHGWVPGCFKRS